MRNRAKKAGAYPWGLVRLPAVCDPRLRNFALSLQYRITFEKLSGSRGAGAGKSGGVGSFEFSELVPNGGSVVGEGGGVRCTWSSIKAWRMLQPVRPRAPMTFYVLRCVLVAILGRVSQARSHLPEEWLSVILGVWLAFDGLLRPEKWTGFW